MWWNRDLADDELQESVIHDSIFASLSVAFILVFMTIHTKVALACSVGPLGHHLLVSPRLCVLRIHIWLRKNDGAQFSQPLRYYGHRGRRRVYIYRPFGQSRARVDDPVKERARRLKLTYRRAGAAMFITSATTAASFFSNVVSPILPLREFGVFMGLTVVGNFFTVMTLYPSALIVWDIGTCAVCKRKKKNERKRSASMELSAPSLIESLDVRDTEVENEEQRAESPVEGAASHIHTTAQFWMKKNAFNLGNDSGFRKIERFFHNVYAPALSAIKWKVIVVLTIVAAAAIYGAVSKFEASDQIPDFFDDSKNLGLIHQTRRKYFGYGAVGTATRPEMSGGFIVPDDHLQPTKKPTTAMPTISPTTPPPTRMPTTAAPTYPITPFPTREPTVPTPFPTRRTRRPTSFPTAKPTTMYPTKVNDTKAPSVSPTTASPTGPTNRPTTGSPTMQPTTREPTPYPTNFPTPYPTTRTPTRYPTAAPTTGEPTQFPTAKPTASPTELAESPCAVLSSNNVIFRVQPWLLRQWQWNLHMRSRMERAAV